jgi:E3 ubiquitin-protein ligase RNF115/126
MDDAYYCHGCSSRVAVNLNPATSEFECGVCGGGAVEAEGQDGLAHFLRRTGENPLEDTDAARRNQLMGQLVNRIMGAGTERQPSFLVVGRQVSAPFPLDALSMILEGLSGADAGEEAFQDVLHRILTNEVSHAGSPPASEEVLRRLPRTVVGAGTEGHLLGGACCGISHDPFEEGDVVVTLSCGHLYIEDNILTWLRVHHTCPICREQVVDSPTDKPL